MSSRKTIPVHSRIIGTRANVEETKKFMLMLPCGTGVSEMWHFQQWPKVKSSQARFGTIICKAELELEILHNRFCVLAIGMIKISAAELSNWLALVGKPKLDQI